MYVCMYVCMYVYVYTTSRHVAHSSWQCSFEQSSYKSMFVIKRFAYISAVQHTCVVVELIRAKCIIFFLPSFLSRRHICLALPSLSLQEDALQDLPLGRRVNVLRSVFHMSVGSGFEPEIAVTVVKKDSNNDTLLALERWITVCGG